MYEGNVKPTMIKIKIQKEIIQNLREMNVGIVESEQKSTKHY